MVRLWGLREVLSHFILGTKSLACFYVDAKLNPADDPSRFVRLRQPTPPLPYHVVRRLRRGGTPFLKH